MARPISAAPILPTGPKTVEKAAFTHTSIRPYSASTRSAAASTAAASATSTGTTRARPPAARTSAAAASRPRRPRAGRAGAGLRPVRGGTRGGMPENSLAVVIATRNRRSRLAHTLEKLLELPERPAVLVVDNASTDGTREMVAARFPAVRTLALPVNRGALARNAGVALLPHRYIAFSDDDSWWEPGALARATGVMERDRRVGLVAAHTTVAPHGTPDPLNRALADSPLRGPAGLPGPAVLGFLGCAAVVRREAFVAAGGYHPLLFFGAEEALLAYDMSATGWVLCHHPGVTAVHGPDPGPRPGRSTLIQRNETLTAWLRRPLPVALRHTWGLARRSPADPAARRALGQLVVRLPAALAARRRLPARVEADVRRLELARDGAG